MNTDFPLKAQDAKVIGNVIIYPEMDMSRTDVGFLETAVILVNRELR